MAGKSNKTVVPENVLRDVFITGLREIKRAGMLPTKFLPYRAPQSARDPKMSGV